MLYGTIAILVVYSLLPSTARFSRAIIILLAAWTTLTVYLNRIISATFIDGLLKPNTRKKNICFIGTANEFERSQVLLIQAGIPNENLTLLLPGEVLDENNQVRESTIVDTIKVKNISEIIFGTEGIPMTNIIHAMIHLSQFDVDFKIALHGGDSIVGSNSVDNHGELYSLDLMTLAKPVTRRQKEFSTCFRQY